LDLTKLVQSEDIAWRIGQLQDCNSDTKRWLWAIIVRNLFYDGAEEHADAALMACQAEPILASALEPVFLPIALDSQQARNLRDRYLEQDLIGRSEELDSAKKAYEQRLTTLIDECESGVTDAWAELDWFLMLRTDGTHVGRTDHPNIKSYPGWAYCDDTTQTRIVKAAEKFILEGSPNVDEWIDSGDIPFRVTAGYQAIYLVFEHDPSFNQNMSDQIWSKWVPAILFYRSSYGLAPQEKMRVEQLFKLVYSRAPEEFLKTLRLQIDLANKRGFIFFSSELESCWDEGIGNVILDRAKDLTSANGVFHPLLNLAVKHGTVGSEEFAKSLITVPLPQSGLPRELAIIGACVLVDGVEDGGWSIIWPAMMSDGEFGKHLAQWIANNFFGGDSQIRFVAKLSDSELADLYIWLSQQYPHKEDERLRGFGSISDNEKIGRWRESLLNTLVNRGTELACNAIKKISTTFPDLEYIQLRLQDSLRLFRQNNWSPLRPEAFLSYVQEIEDQHSRQREQEKIQAVLGKLWVVECSAEGEEILTGQCGQGTAFPLASVGLLAIIR